MLFSKRKTVFKYTTGHTNRITTLVVVSAISACIMSCSSDKITNKENAADYSNRRAPVENPGGIASLPSRQNQMGMPPGSPNIMESPPRPDNQYNPSQPYGTTLQDPMGQQPDGIMPDHQGQGPMTGGMYMPLPKNYNNEPEVGFDAMKGYKNNAPIDPYPVNPANNQYNSNQNNTTNQDQKSGGIFSGIKNFFGGGSSSQKQPDNSYNGDMNAPSSQAMPPMPPAFPDSNMPPNGPNMNSPYNQNNLPPPPGYPQNNIQPNGSNSPSNQNSNLQKQFEPLDLEVKGNGRIDTTSMFPLEQYTPKDDVSQKLSQYEKLNTVPEKPTNFNNPSQIKEGIDQLQKDQTDANARKDAIQKQQDSSSSSDINLKPVPIDDKSGQAPAGNNTNSPTTLPNTTVNNSQDNNTGKPDLKVDSTNNPTGSELSPPKLPDGAFTDVPSSQPAK